MNGIKARLLTTRGEFGEAVALQKQIWGFDDIELLPVRLFAVASKIGGQSFAAFDGERMIAFTIAIPGVKHNHTGTRPYLHSNMLGVLPEYRNRHVGRMLKLEQRKKAIEDGVELMEWTFDPLELKNAYFNIERLGAVVRRFVLNKYGTTTSHLHGSLPTDRCVAEWWMASPRVEAVLAGRAPERPPIEACIEVPPDIEILRHDQPAMAREIQKAVSAQFVEHTMRGLAVVGFERPGRYLLGRLK